MRIARDWSTGQPNGEESFYRRYLALATTNCSYTDRTIRKKVDPIRKKGRPDKKKG